MASNSKHRKGHKQKVEARKKRLELEKKHFEKQQREYVMELIKQEQLKGQFENAPSLTPGIPGTYVPMEGPSI